MGHQDPVKKREYMRAYYARNKAKIEAQKKAWREANPEKMRRYYETYVRDHGPEDRARKRAAYYANPEKRKKKNIYTSITSREWRQRMRVENRARYILHNLRKSLRGKKGDIDRAKFDITEEWLRVRLNAGVCEMSGFPFDLTIVRGPFYPTIDRIEPSGPYTQANCRMVIWFLNRALSNHGEEFALDIFQRVLELRGRIVPLLGKVA